MTDKQINKWLRKEFRPIGWILIFYYLLMNLMVSLEAVADLARQMLWNVSTGNFPFDVNLDALMDNAWGYILCIFLGIILLHAWKGPDYWSEEIFRREERMRPSVFFCALILCMGSQMVNSLWLTGLELVMNLFGSSMMPMLEMVSGSTSMELCWRQSPKNCFSAAIFFGLCGLMENGLPFWEAPFSLACSTAICSRAPTPFWWDL